MNSEPTPEIVHYAMYVAFVGTAILVALILWVWSKGRPFASGEVFRASRLSAGNHLFPTQVLLTDSAVVQYKPRWIGKTEETIHMAHVSSVKIETGAMFSDVLIETSGGSDPIRCHGHHKRDAVRMKDLIEHAQNLYYRSGDRPVGPTSTSR